MSILIIPEITDKYMTSRKMIQIEDRISKLMPNLAIANMAALSVFAPEMDEAREETALDLITRGYFVLTSSDQFLTFDIYLGIVLAEDMENIDYIIYESPAAKEILEARTKVNILPKAKEIIVVTGEMSLENEIYKRTARNNISTRA